MRKLTNCLWFDGQAEEAANFYTGVFKNSRITNTTRTPQSASEVSGQPAGRVMTVEFEIEGTQFMALNGGPEFKFNESVSFMIPCENQEEIDYFWNRLTDGGEESMCGWLKDRFGVSWQVTPARLEEMMRDPNQAKVEAVTAAFLPMRKLDLATIEKAYAEA